MNTEVDRVVSPSDESSATIFEWSPPRVREIPIIQTMSSTGSFADISLPSPFN